VYIHSTVIAALHGADLERAQQVEHVAAIGYHVRGKAFEREGLQLGVGQE